MNTAMRDLLLFERTGLRLFRMSEWIAVEKLLRDCIFQSVTGPLYTAGFMALRLMIEPVIFAYAFSVSRCNHIVGQML